MKKWTKILICLILCVFGVGMFGCKDKRTPEEKAFTYPMGASHQVSGNGGLAVKKGNYIYFVNGFKKAENSDRSSNTLGALMLAKLNEYGELVVDENGQIKDENYITISDRLAGFEATDVAVFGDYLYFTTVCQEDDAETEEQAKSLVDFNRIKLDKTSELEKIYESESKNSTIQFKWYQAGNEVKLVVFEKDENELVEINAKGDVVRKIEDVQNVNLADNYSEIFYVCSNSEGNVKFKTFKLGSETPFLTHTVSTAPEVKFVEGSYAYVLENNALTKYRTADAGAKLQVLDDYTSYKSVKLAPNGDVLIAVSEEGKGRIIEVYNNGVVGNFYIEENASELEIIGFANGTVIYRDNEKNVKSLNYTNSNAEPVLIANLADMSTDYFDIDGSYMYFYQTVGTGEYLHRIVVDNGAQDAEMVGVYLEADIPEADEEN